MTAPSNVPLCEFEVSRAGVQTMFHVQWFIFFFCEDMFQPTTGILPACPYCTWKSNRSKHYGGIQGTIDQAVFIHPNCPNMWSLIQKQVSHGPAMGFWLCNKFPAHSREGAKTERIFSEKTYLLDFTMRIACRLHFERVSFFLAKVGKFTN